MDKDTVGKKLKYLREKDNLTMDNLANIFRHQYGSAISKSMISSWENGRYLISYFNLDLYIKYFNVPHTYFLNDEIEPEELDDLIEVLSEAETEKPRAFYALKWANKETRNEISDKIFFESEKLNNTGLRKLLEYSKDLSKINDYLKEE